MIERHNTKGDQMRVRTGHITFKKGTKYQSLEPVFPDMLMKFLEETDQIPEEEEYFKVLVESNLRDLRRNKKPEGFNRQSKMRMVFPIKKGNITFYMAAPYANTEVVTVSESMSMFLDEKGLPNTLTWDKVLLDEKKKKKGKKR